MCGFFFYQTVVTLRSTGSDVNKGFEPPLFEEAELGGGVRVTGTGGEGVVLHRYPEILAEAEGDFRKFSFLF